MLTAQPEKSLRSSPALHPKFWTGASQNGIWGGEKGRHDGDYGHEGPLLWKTKLLASGNQTTAPALLPPLARDIPGAPGMQGGLLLRAGKKEGRQEGESAVANGSLDAHPETTSVSPGEGAGCLPRRREADSKKTQGPTEKRGPEARPYTVKRPRAVALPPLRAALPSVAKS